MDKAKKRPIVGFMTGSYHSDHPRHTVPQIYECLSKENVDVRYFLGTECRSFLDEFEMEENAFDYQYASLYNYSNFDDLDVLIIGFGTIANFQDSLTYQRFVSTLPQVPIVVMESDETTGGEVHVLIDNEQGIADCVNHLVKECGCHEIAFVSGPSNNPEAQRRLQGFLTTMAANGLSVPEERITYGDFTENVDPIIEELLDRAGNIDAIVSANDEMAVSIYRVLKSRGIQIGEDILVTGFDDMEMARYMDPPLTTIRQDTNELTKIAAEKAMAILRGEQPGSEKVRMRLIRRESTGATSAIHFRAAESGGEASRQLIGHVKTLYDRQNRGLVGAMMLRELLFESVDTRTFFGQFGKELCELHTKSAAILLTEKSLVVTPNEIIRPEKLRLYLYQECGETGNRIETYDDASAPEITWGELQNVRPQTDEPVQTVSFLLYYEQYQYGIFTVETRPEDIPFYYMLSIELGSGIRFLYLSLTQQTHQAALRKQNEQLGRAATHDMLTGLYNRGGGYNNMAEQIGRNVGRRFIGVAADLDHLKQINDHFGHAEGDSAIRTAADILSSCLPGEGTVARTGGDEFIVMFLLGEKGDGERYLDRISEKCEEYNQSSGKPYYVELSTGYIEFSSEKGDDLTTIYQKADYMMYLAKQARRSSVVREQKKGAAGRNAGFSVSTAGVQPPKEDGASEADLPHRKAREHEEDDQKGQSRREGLGGQRKQKDPARLRSLRQSLTDLLALGWFLPMLLALLAMSWMIYVRLMNQTENTVQTSAGYAIQLVQDRLSDCETASKDASYQPTLRAAYNEYLRDGSRHRLYSTAEQFLTSKYRYDNNFRSAILYYADDPEHPVYSLNFNTGAVFSDIQRFRDLAEDEILTHAQEIDTATVLVAAGDRVYMVRNLMTEKFVPYATLILELNEEQVFGPLDGIWGGSEYRVYLGDEIVAESTGEGYARVSVQELAGEGGAAASAKEEAYLVALKEAAAAPATEQQLIRIGRKHTLVSAAASVQKDRLTALVYLDRSFIYAEIRTLMTIIVVALLLMIPLLYLVARFFRNKISNPVQRMSGAYRRIEEGRYGTRIEERSDSSEFYYMEESFNSMAAQLQEQFEKIYLEEINARDARIMALQSQINPHFLNNTLEIINWEARLRGNDKVSTMIDALSTMLSATMNRDNRKVVPLEEEMSYVEAYLKIIEMRFGDKFHCERQIDAELMACPVPRFVVQPIVENAVEHGYGAERGISMIIRIFREQLPVDGVHSEALIVEVENAGEFTEANRRRVEELLSEDYQPKNEGHVSLGIRNVDQRLKLMCGEEYGLSIYGTENETTVSRLRIRLP